MRRPESEITFAWSFMCEQVCNAAFCYACMTSTTARSQGTPRLFFITLGWNLRLGLSSIQGVARPKLPWFQASSHIHTRWVLRKVAVLQWPRAALGTASNPIPHFFVLSFRPDSSAGCRAAADGLSATVLRITRSDTRAPHIRT